jgi:topoisomerase-4 subunit A
MGAYRLGAEEVRQKFGQGSEGGARRTQFAEAGEVEEVPLEAMIDREPVTVVCSTMGWIRAMTGHIDLAQELKFKDGDTGRFVFHAETTDKLAGRGTTGGSTRCRSPTCRAGADGRAGAPHGRPAQRGRDRRAVRSPSGAGCLVASSAGDGFVVPEDEVVAQTRPESRC